MEENKSKMAQQLIDAWASKFQDDLVKAMKDSTIHGVGFLKVEQGRVEYSSLEDVEQFIEGLKSGKNRNEY